MNKLELTNTFSLLAKNVSSNEWSKNLAHCSRIPILWSCCCSYPSGYSLNGHIPGSCPQSVTSSTQRFLLRKHKDNCGFPSHVHINEASYVLIVAQAVVGSESCTLLFTLCCHYTFKIPPELRVQHGILNLYPPLTPKPKTCRPSQRRLWLPLLPCPYHILLSQEDL